MSTLTKLYIEPTSRCNLNCRMCFRNSWVDETYADMEMDVFTAAMNSLPDSVETVFFGGMGEPLFHSNIIPMISRAAEAGKNVELVTNASLLTPEMSRDLLQAGLSMLWVSIESFDAPSYESIRIKGKFGSIQKNIMEFNRERKRAGSNARLGVNFVIMKNNVHQLAHIPYFISRFRVNEVNISNLIPSDKASESELLYDRLVDWNIGLSTKMDIPKINLPLMNWRDDGVLEGVKALLSSTTSQVLLSGQPLTRRANYCRFIEEGTAFIRSDGNVSPCMGLLHSADSWWLGRKRLIRHHSFGNVAETGLDDIWNSEPYSAFRERVKRFDFSPCMRCSGCDDWEENTTDCFGNEKPTCGACLWAEGVVSCP